MADNDILDKPIIIKARCVKPCTLHLNQRVECENGLWDVQVIAVPVNVGEEHTFEWYNDAGAFTVEIGKLWGLVDFPVYYHHFVEKDSAP